MRPSGDPFDGKFGAAHRCGNRMRLVGQIWVGEIQTQASLWQCSACKVFVTLLRGLTLCESAEAILSPEAVAAVESLDPVRETQR